MDGSSADEHALSKEVDKKILLLTEALEYCVLMELSVHLSTYFQGRGGKRKIGEFQKSDIPSVVLNNRFLSILSTPIEDRAVFLKTGYAKNPPTGKIYHLFAPDGARYSRCELMLPVGTKVSRPHAGNLQIDTPRVRVDIDVSNVGYGVTLPRHVDSDLLGVDYKNIQVIGVTISIRIIVKLSSLFRVGGWDDYLWADSFLEHVHKYASADAYFDRIGWDVVSAIIERDKTKASRGGLSRIWAKPTVVVGVRCLRGRVA